MRNFQRGYKNDSGSNFSRGDRRNDRDGRYQANETTYKRSGDKGFNRNFTDRNNKPRRDYNNDQSNRNSFNQERRDNHVGNRSFGGRPFQERGFRNEKPDRYRNQTPPRSRDREGHSGTRFNRPNDARIRRPVSPSNFRNRNDFQSTSVRPSRGGAVRRTIASSGPPRILRRNDLRSSLISKRTAPINRSKEYIKKIKQARLKLSEVSKTKTNDEPKTPPKESKKEHDDEDDFLDVANDVTFDEDVEISDKNVSAKTDENVQVSNEHVKSEGDKNEAMETLNNSGTSEEKTRKDREKSGSRENDTRSSSIDLNCVHCMTKCSSILDFRNHLTRRIHLIAMKKVSMKVRMTLNRLRKIQRDRQLEIEARLKNVEKIPSKYCQICKLYFRQSKIEHRDSDDHKKIRNFLKPYCKICHVQLLSAMKYEIHKCTINHLKMKGDRQEPDEDDDSVELDLGDFKTVDSIGDVDGEEVESDDDEDMDATPVGQEFVNKVEVNYCSLCRDYIPMLRTSKDEKVILDHCKSKKHLKWYYQSKKKDETQANASKAKSGDEPKDGDTATGNSKKSVSLEKDKEISATVAAQDNGNEVSEEPSKKFKRYFEVSGNVDNDD